MKKLALKTYGKIIALILSIFGLSNCDIIEPKVEYGTPSASYSIKGKVIDRETQKPIKGIGIIARDKQNIIYQKDTTYTDESGEYDLEFESFPYPGGKAYLIAKDLDGFANGSYQTDSLELTFTSEDRIKNGSGWNAGTFQKINQNFMLNSPQIIPMYGVMYVPLEEKKDEQ